jgi:glucuronate isomerase
MSAKNIIRKSNVTHICTTDDPVDDLEWHDKIAEDTAFDTKVLPAWRPDKAMNLESPDYLSYLKILEGKANVRIDSYHSLQMALKARITYFHERKCRISDHALNYIMYAPASEETINAIFEKRLQGMSLNMLEIHQFKTTFMISMGRLYRELGWAMQLHYGCKRNNNSLAYQLLGPDTGFDYINNYAPSDQMSDLLNALHDLGSLPKTIIYSLNPSDNAVIDSIIGCFQDSSAIGKMQHGSPWWFNDHKAGITEHLTSLANLGLLAGFVGMLTDSRSFLSYPRHEYFRRILCDLFGTWVENGEYPQDYEALGSLVSNISYYNALNYFGL